jgi:hypothetical protein
MLKLDAENSSKKAAAPSSECVAMEGENAEGNTLPDGKPPTTDPSKTYLISWI